MITTCCENAVFVENRKIRSAGRTTGSVEITLPPDFFVFAGEESMVSIVCGKEPVLHIKPKTHSIIELLNLVAIRIRNCLELSDGPDKTPVFQFTADASFYKNGIVYAGLKDCGMLTRGKTGSRGSSDAMRLVAAIASHEIDRLQISKDKHECEFMGKAIVYVVFGESAGLDLFELDTIDNSLQHRMNGSDNTTASILDSEPWIDAAPAVAKLIAYLEELRETKRSVDNERENWKRAERLASKVF